MLAVSAGSLSPQTLWQFAGLAAGLVMIGLIAVVEARAKARLLPKRSFTLATPLGALYLLIALLMLSMQPEIFVPYLLQHLHGQPPLWAGYLAALMAIGWTAATLISARWQETNGARLMVAGPALTFAGLVLLAIFLPM
ncbi:MAG: MFS transporter, partial [Parvibaculaceae bacterium]